jgi:hypothetical protein
MRTALERVVPRADRRQVAIARSAGIGVFPAHTYALGRKIVPLKLIAPVVPDQLVSHDPGWGRRPGTLQADGLIEAFNSAKFPWFKNEIHPSQIKAVYKDKPLIQLFGGFSTEGR